jgi:DNA-binding response OmpR family regulator
MADVFEVTTPAGVVLVDFDDEAATWSGADAAIACLRKLVEVDAAAPRYIQTVRGRGYTFVPDEREEVNEVQG